MKHHNQKLLLKCDEICRIIKACAESGVLEFKLSTLFISFGKQAQEVPPLEEKLSAAHPATAIAEPNHDKINKATLEEDELKEREDQIAELLITDPSRFEELIQQGELEEDNDYGRSEDFEDT